MITLDCFDNLGLMKRDKVNKLVYGYINEVLEEYDIADHHFFYFQMI